MASADTELYTLSLHDALPISDSPWTPTGLKAVRAIEAKLKEKNHG